jgi:glucose-6-phosphate isomerase
MPVSKSGTTIGTLESMFAFSDHKILLVTSPDTGALSILAKEKGLDIIPHPPVGGRYSGLTSSAFAPALFFDIDVEAIDNGARTMYKYCHPGVAIDKNLALQLAASLYLLEKKGYEEIFCPIYSSKLGGFENLIVQLMHESVCKKARGQTIYCAEAPESQHHTNQRFFGGRKNVIGLFVTVESQQDMESKVAVPDAVKQIKVRDGTLENINKVPYAKALEFEFQGTYQDAINNKIPCAHISLDKISPFSIGEFLGFWHYVAVYSSWLRDVNAFDQPQVETSKEISFKLRKDHHL